MSICREVKEKALVTFDPNCSLSRKDLTGVAKSSGERQTEANCEISRCRLRKSPRGITGTEKMAENKGGTSFAPVKSDSSRLNRNVMYSDLDCSGRSDV